MTALDLVLTVVGVLAVGVASVSAKLRRLPLSEPLIGLLAGLGLWAVLPLLPAPAALTLPSPVDDPGGWETATRLLLAVSVMGVALRYPIHQPRRHVAPVLLLLLVVMPLVTVISAGTAWLLGVGLGAAILLGAAVAPTDPVLASSVVTGEPAEKDLPLRDRVVLSMESGANDGLALPLVLVATTLAGRLGDGMPSDIPAAVLESTYQVVVAVLVGAACGALAGMALRAGEGHGAVEAGPWLVFALVLALGVLGLCGLLQADGVLGVFCAGLAVNAVAPRGDTSNEGTVDDGVNRFVVLPLFLVLGATLPDVNWSRYGWTALAVAVAVLLVRRLPLVLALRRPLGLALPDALFLGWFGPVGVSALFYAVLATERGAGEAHLPLVIAVVAASTVLHGVSSAPLRSWYVARAGTAQQQERHEQQQDQGRSADRGRADRT